MLLLERAEPGALEQGPLQSSSRQSGSGWGRYPNLEAKPSYKAGDERAQLLSLQRWAF